MNESIHQPSEELPKGLVRDIQSYLDGTIAEADFRSLEALLERSPEARALYRSYANMDVNLREVCEEQDADEGGDIVRLPVRRRAKFSLLQAAATFILGAGLVYLMADWKAGMSERGRGLAPGLQSPTAGSLVEVVNGGMVEGGLAILTKSIGVEWEKGAKAYPVGAILPADTLKLVEGLLQVEFFSGAMVVVEGPAELELVDPMRAICHHGKTRANVPEAAHGFTLASERLDVVDLGTEFALVVDRDGHGEVHVFDGEVEVHQKPGGEMHNVMSGNGVRFTDGNAEFLPLNEMGFVDAGRVSFLENAEADLHLQRWLAYSEELKANPDVLLYYSFEKDSDERSGWARKLRNVRKMVAEPMHGAIVGCSWSEGRWKGKDSLEFKRAGDRVRIQIPGKHDELTLMAWVRIDGFDRELTSLMLSDNWVPGGVHWQFTRSGELIFGTRIDRSDGGHYETGPVLNQSHLGRWIQLAVSYDSTRKTVVHYVNGRRVWGGEVEQHVSLNVPRGELGNWKTDYDAGGTALRNLNGRMDEFVVFSRGLSDDEIRDIFESGKPHS